jgi:hypothetical protein
MAAKSTSDDKKKIEEWKIYVASAVAQKAPDKIKQCPVWCIARSAEEAEGILLKKWRAAWPEWVAHDVYPVELTEQTQQAMRDGLNSKSGVCGPF